MSLLKIDMHGNCGQLPVTPGATPGKKMMSSDNYINIFTRNPEVKLNPNMYIYNLSLYVGEQFNSRHSRKRAKIAMERLPGVEGGLPAIFRQLCEEFSWN